MANFVLIHGAWHGGWCWRRVAQGLMNDGHRVHAVTLTGLGDRAHLMSRDITLETHIKDVVDTIVCEELTDLIVVGHSYAGMLITAVADRLPELVKYLVYVDAVIPKPGESWSSTHAQATREARIKAIEHDPMHSLPPPDPSVYGLAEDDYRWAQRRQTPHPGATYVWERFHTPSSIACRPRWPPSTPCATAPPTPAFGMARGCSTPAWKSCKPDTTR
jgi:pimeloyl-ACP methyl ester carboxylesterase